MAIKILELKPFQEPVSDYEKAEEIIKDIFRKEVYLPIMKLLGVKPKALQNAMDSLISAIRDGKITFSSGVFSGSFTASTSKELKALGAKWDRKGSAWKIQKAKLPRVIQEVISSSDYHFQERLSAIDKKLQEVLPEELAGKVNLTEAFDRALFKANKSFAESVKGITIAPSLTLQVRKRIALEWSNNMQLFIKDFTEEEIKKLRLDISKSVYAGNRYESAIDSIQTSYGVTAAKAKFLARQETALLMTKYVYSRYEEAGIDEYNWYHVVGSAAHPVRPVHQALGDAKEKDGSKKIYRFSDPPIVDEKGNRKNPKQDYNCRCFARPIVRFNTNK